MNTYRVFFIKEKTEVTVKEGTTVLEAERIAGLSPDAPCGGAGKCGKCMVKINGAVEKACQTKITTDIEVETIEKKSEHRILVKGTERAVTFSPELEILDIEIPPCTVGENSSDWARLCEAIKSCRKKDIFFQRTASAADMKKRTAVLAAKQELIGKVIADACDRVKNLDEGKYFEILKSMAEKYLLPREGEICFSKKDLERMPANFREEIKGLAQKKGGTLEISGEARNIDGGFILVYGGIEENCSIDAMFAEKRDELLDQVRKILFA